MRKLTEALRSILITAKKKPVLLAAIISLILSAILTGKFIVWRDFPLNDGGFWYVYAKHLININFRHSNYIQFNGQIFPLVYPPLAAYLLAVIQILSGLSLEWLLLYLPSVFFLLSLVLLCYFYANLGISQGKLIIAILLLPFFIFPLRWFLMGGGISRSLGLLLQILFWNLLLTIPQTKTEQKNRLYLAGIILGLAVLTHPTALLWSVAGLFIMNTRIRVLLPVFAGVFIVCAPWLVQVLENNGLYFFSNAFLSGGQSFFSRYQLRYVLGLGNLLILPVLLGFFFCLQSSHWRIALVWLACITFDSRGVAVGNGVILMPLFAAISIDEILIAFNSTAKGNVLRYTFLAVFLIILSQFSLEKLNHQRSFLQQLYAEEVRDLKTLNFTQQDKPVMVLSVHRLAGDALGEWLTALQGVEVINLHQTMEWFGMFKKILDYQFQVIEPCCGGDLTKCREITAAYPDTYFVNHKKSCSGFTIYAQDVPACTVLQDLQTLRLYSCSDN